MSKIRCRFCGGAGCGGCGGLGLGDPCSGCGGSGLLGGLGHGGGGQALRRLRGLRPGQARHGQRGPVAVSAAVRDVQIAFPGLQRSHGAAAKAHGLLGQMAGSTLGLLHPQQGRLLRGGRRTSADDARLCALYCHDPISPRLFCLPANESQRSLTIIVAGRFVQVTRPGAAPGLLLFQARTRPGRP